MDTQLLSELRWIRGALVVIAMALTLLVIGIWIVAGVVSAKAMRTQLSFGDRAKRLLDRDETSKLIEVCEAQLTEYPSDAEAWWYLAQAAYRTFQLKRALEAVDKVRALRPEWPWIEQFGKAVEEQLSQQAPEPVLHVVPPPMIIHVKPANPFAANDKPPGSSPAGEPTNDPAS